MTFSNGRHQPVMGLGQTETCHSKQAKSINRGNLHQWKYIFLKAKAQQILHRVALLKNEYYIQFYGSLVKFKEILNTYHLLEIQRKIDGRHQLLPFVYIFSKMKTVFPHTPEELPCNLNTRILESTYLTLFVNPLFTAGVGRCGEGKGPDCWISQPKLPNYFGKNYQPELPKRKDGTFAKHTLSATSETFVKKHTQGNSNSGLP